MKENHQVFYLKKNRKLEKRKKKTRKKTKKPEKNEKKNERKKRRKKNVKKTHTKKYKKYKKMQTHHRHHHYSPPLTTTHHHSPPLTTASHHSPPLTTTHHHSPPLTTTHCHPNDAWHVLRPPECCFLPCTFAFTHTWINTSGWFRICGECFLFLAWDCCVPRDQRSHHSSGSSNSKRKRSDIEKKNLALKKNWPMQNLHNVWLHLSLPESSAVIQDFD